MKKRLCFSLTLLLLLSTLVGCGGSSSESAESVTPESSASVEMADAITIVESGLTFALPAEWLTNTDVNLFPESYMSFDGDLFTKVKYNFIPEENFAELDDPDSDVPITDLMLPLFSILVVQEEMADNETFVSESSIYDVVNELPSQDGYLYYFCYDYNGDTSDYSDAAMYVYTDLALSLTAVENSVVTAPPAFSSLMEEAPEIDNDYLAFISTTLDGENANSSMFFDYDLTVVNFWGSYAYPDINELAELEAFYQQLQTELPNVNFVQVVIDTPDAAAEEVARAAYAEHNVTFVGISPDTTLANWIMTNLTGIPTTIFVDNTCKILDFTLEGAKEADYYMESTKEVLTALDTTK